MPECYACHGSGECPACFGIGKTVRGILDFVATPLADDLFDNTDDTCQSCDGSGRCSVCRNDSDREENEASTTGSDDQG